jgi:hypothetical protein
VSYDILP